jgi:C4-dicarboxylate transporter DctM subunit
VQVSRAEKWRLLLQSWPLPLIVLGVIGGLYTGAISATEAGAFGAVIALLAAILNRTLTWDSIKGALFETVTISAAIFLIAMGAVMFAQMLSLSGIPGAIGRAMTGNASSVWTFLLCVTLFYLILGMFLDAIGLMLVTLPIVQPFLGVFGIDVIWFGVLVVKLVEIGLLTPPIGLNLFVVNAAVGKTVPFSTVVKGTAQFLWVELLILFILMLFPALSLFLPDRMG